MVAVPELRLRHGFEITGPQSHLVQVNGQGAPVAPASPDDNFVLTVNPNQPAAEIFLIDQTLKKQAQSRRILTAGFPFGVYKLKIRVGHTVTESVILLDQDLDFSTSKKASRGTLRRSRILWLTSPWHPRQSNPPRRCLAPR